MFSLKNSYDYKRYYNNNVNTLPFIGEFEPTASYTNILISVKTTQNDTLYIDFTNYQTDTDPEMTESYNVNNTEEQFVILPKLKFFRIRITTNEPFSQTDQRIYHTSLSTTQILGTDENGHIVVSAQIDGIVLDQNTSSICVFDSNHGSILVDSNDNLRTTIRDGNNNSINIDASGNLRTNKLSKTTDNVAVYDSNGNNITVDASGNLKISKLNKTNDNIAIYDSSGSSIKVDTSGNLKTALYDSNGVGLTTDTSGNLKVSASISNIALDKTTSSIAIFDSCGNSITTDSAGNLNVTSSFNQLSTDAFGRLRVSNPFTLFDSKNVGKMNNKFTYGTSGRGLAPVYNQNTSSFALTCDGSGSLAGRVVNESKYRCSYQPGKSLLILNTFVFDAATRTTCNTTQRVGYFDEDNGIYLEINPNGVYIVRKSSVITTTSILIDNWNGDSALKTEIDFTKAQIFWIDIEWLGVGSVRTGFVIDGKFRLAHTFHHANYISSVYMTSAQLPIRYEVISTGAAGTLKQICSSVISEGGYEGDSFVRHIGTDASANIFNISGTVFTPVLALRIGKDPSGTLYNSIVVPAQLSLFLSSNQTSDIVKYSLLLNPTFNTPIPDASWNYYSDYATNDTSSTMQYYFNPSGTPIGTITNTGTILNSSYVENRTVSSLSSANDFNLQLGRIINSIGATTGTTYSSDILVLVIAYLNGPITQSVKVAAELGWYEL